MLNSCPSPPPHPFSKFLDSPLSLIILKPIFHCDATPFALGTGIGLDTQRHNFALPIPTCWYLKTRKFAFSPTPNLKLANPKASQWNIGCIGSQTQISRVCHVHFMFFGVDFICVWYPLQTRFQWNIDLSAPTNDTPHLPGCDVGE